MPNPRQESGRNAPLPMSPAEVTSRGWNAVDIVFVTGDAYVDHPSFAMAILGRVLEAAGYRVAILSQPDWRSCDPWRSFGRPRVCFAVSAGNMDSMLNHYTAARKVRNDDAFSPGGRIGNRPDRATLAYCQRAREAYKGVPIIAGGVEASLRRAAHYDYWSDKVRRSIILDAKPDLLVYGMGESPLLEIVNRLTAGESIRELRDIRGTVYRLGATESVPEKSPDSVATVELPSYEDVSSNREAFARMTKALYLESNPYNARRLVQRHGRETVVVNPPAWPLNEHEMDRIYGLSFTRRPHPAYGAEEIPAFAVVKDSVQIMRGCFGGCAFCSLTAHQGRVIQARSEASILAEIRRIVEAPGASGTVSDIGGPTANMYAMKCRLPEVRAKCRRLSCVHPTICRLLDTNHGPLIRLMKAARRLRGVKRVLVASGIRMDLARQSRAYVTQLARHHVGGLLKVAPEHVDRDVLRLMKKPEIGDFKQFAAMFREASRVTGRRQYLVPYFISGHPGSDLAAMVEVALFLKQSRLKPEKVQDFIPNPMDLATCMYHTGLNPMTGEPVYVAKGARERRLQRALLQYFDAENYDDVREALEQADRIDLIGNEPQCLISASRPKRSKSRRGKRGRPGHPRSKSGMAGYRPHRRSTRRRRP